MQVSRRNKSLLGDYYLNEDTRAVFLITSVPGESKIYGTSVIIEIHAAKQYIKSRAHDVHYVHHNNVLYTMSENYPYLFKNYIQMK